MPCQHEELVWRLVAPPLVPGEKKLRAGRCHVGGADGESTRGELPGQMVTRRARPEDVFKTVGNSQGDRFNFDSHEGSCIGTKSGCPKKCHAEQPPQEMCLWKPPSVEPVVEVEEGARV